MGTGYVSFEGGAQVDVLPTELGTKLAKAEDDFQAQTLDAMAAEFNRWPSRDAGWQCVAIGSQLSFEASELLRDILSAYDHKRAKDG